MPIIGALPFNLQNGTTADASQVMADFNKIVTDTNAHAAATGANSDITSLSGLTTPLSVSQGGSGSQIPAPFPFAGGYRNIARRNGGLEVWQRGAGGSATFNIAASNTTYGPDGWYLLNGVNQAAFISQEAGLVNGSRYSAKVFRDGGQTGTGDMVFGYPLDSDEIFPMLGQYVRLSLTLQAAANFSAATVAIKLVVGTGSPVKQVVGYTGSTAPISVAQAITTSPVRYQFNSAAVIPTNTRQAEIQIVWTPAGTAGAADAFTIDDVQLEVVPASSGYGASNFERLIFEEQLFLCQRYFWKTFDYNTAPASNAGKGTGEVLWMAGSTATVISRIQVWHPVQMRVAPTRAYFNPAASGAEARNEDLNSNCTNTGVSFSYSTLNSSVLSTELPASTQPANIMGLHATFDAGI